MEDAVGAVPIELAPDKIRHNFHLGLDKRSLIQQVLNPYGIQATMDSSVRSQIVPFDEAVVACCAHAPTANVTATSTSPENCLLSIFCRSLIRNPSSSLQCRAYSQQRTRKVRFHRTHFQTGGLRNLS
jgi:hypothetical protein